MRVLLIYPNSRNQVLGWGDLGAVAEPLALEYLAAGAMLDGHEVRVLDLRLHPNELEPVVLEFHPDAVGITGYSMHVLSVVAISGRISAPWSALADGTRVRTYFCPGRAMKLVHAMAAAIFAVMGLLTLFQVDQLFR